MHDTYAVKEVVKWVNFSLLVLRVISPHNVNKWTEGLQFDCEFLEVAHLHKHTINNPLLIERILLCVDIEVECVKQLAIIRRHKKYLFQILANFH